MCLSPPPPCHAHSVSVPFPGGVGICQHQCEDEDSWGWGSIAAGVVPSGAPGGRPPLGCMAVLADLQVAGDHWWDQGLLWAPADTPRPGAGLGHLQPVG